MVELVQILTLDTSPTVLYFDTLFGFASSPFQPTLVSVCLAIGSTDSLPNFRTSLPTRIICKFNQIKTCKSVGIKLELHGAICLTDSFVFKLGYRAMKYESAMFNGIVADKSRRVTMALWIFLIT